MIPLNLAARTVRCPDCPAIPGERCSSTGGGNYAAVPPHSGRIRRIIGWTEEQVLAAEHLVRQQSTRPAHLLPAGFYAATEAAARPIPPRPAKPLTPRGVRLSEQQARVIELAAQTDGVLYVSTAHFHGDAARRQVADAVLDRGILRHVEYTSGGYDRVLELTEFGWQVYRQHRMVIRRLDDAVAARFEERAREREASGLCVEGAQ